MHGARNVVLTGHSLGGAVANIVGSRFALKSVSFSPPGIYYGGWENELVLPV